MNKSFRQLLSRHNAFKDKRYLQQYAACLPDRRQDFLPEAKIRRFFARFPVLEGA
jgi:hypothetical protein